MPRFATRCCRADVGSGSTVTAPSLFDSERTRLIVEASCATSDDEARVRFHQRRVRAGLATVDVNRRTRRIRGRSLAIRRPA